MKRFVAALILLVLILSVSLFSLWDMKQCIEKIELSARELRDTAPDDPLMTEKSISFVEQWNQTEGRLIFYVHHDVLDHITQLVAELPALARHGEYGALYARIDALSALMDDLWNSAIPNYRNLL